MALILVVDDNPDICEILEILLEEAGHQVAVRDTGPGAVAYCAAEPPDLVLLDVTLPGMDGIEVLRAVRGDLGLATLPVVLLTARAHPDDVAGGLTSGADDYLVKPFDAARLLATVEARLH